MHLNHKEKCIVYVQVMEKLESGAMLRIVAERSGMHHAAILPFPGNGGMPLFSINYDFFIRNDHLGVHRVFSHLYHQKKWEKVMTTPHSAFSRIWQNAIFFYNFWLVSSEMIGVHRVSSNPEHQNCVAKNYGDALFRFFQEMGECRFFWNSFYFLHQKWSFGCSKGLCSPMTSKK